MNIKHGSWYKQRSGLIIGPLLKIDDLQYQFWCPDAGYMCCRLDGAASLSGWIEDATDLVEEVVSEKYKYTYAQVSSEFNWFTAAIVCGMIHIHLEKEIQEHHIQELGSFAKELELEFSSQLYSICKDHAQEYSDALSCWRVFYDWETRRTLAGLGGCEKVTFKHLIERNLLSITN